MNILNRANEIENKITSFSKTSYHKSEVLPELLNLQNEIVSLSIAEEDAGCQGAKLQDVENYFEQLNAEKGSIANEELASFKKGSIAICNKIKSEISGNRGESKAFFFLDKIRERHTTLKNVELHNDEVRSELDAVVVTPKCIFIIEVKNTNRDIFIDEEGNYYRTGKYLRWDSNIRQKMNIKENLLRESLSNLNLDQIKISKLVVFTNNRVKVENSCKDIRTTFLSQLPHIIDGYIGKFIYTQSEMNKITSVIEESNCEEYYPAELDIIMFKKDFAALKAKLEQPSMETPLQNNKATIKERITDRLSILATIFSYFESVVDKSFQNA